MLTTGKAPTKQVWVVVAWEDEETSYSEVALVFDDPTTARTWVARENGLIGWTRYTYGSVDYYTEQGETL